MLVAVSISPFFIADGLLAFAVARQDSDLFRAVIVFHLQYNLILFLCVVGLTDEYAP